MASSNNLGYKQIVCGGTFDLFHKGHKTFLSKILEQTDSLILGLTTDRFASEKEGEHESYEIRKENLEKFLPAFNKNVEIVPIDDLYGPLLSKDVNPDAIALTEETKNALNPINEKRREIGLSILKSIIIPLEKAEDGGVISSTRIRSGEINREGRLYLNPKWKNKILVLPESLREELHKPFGDVLNSVPKGLDPLKTIAVGDVTAKLFNENDLNHLMSIVDFQVHRERKFASIKDLGFDQDIKQVIVKNEHSTLTSDLFNAVKEAFRSTERIVILVDGEEDLAVIPCLLLAPLDYLIFYGQPNEGLVRVSVTEENKEKAYRLASKFASN